MSSGALALTLAAAALHAGWNALLAGARDVRAATTVALVLGVLLFAPVAVVQWDVEAEALPYIAASAALELAYFVLLTRAYAGAELSVVYPVARGTAPVVVVALAALAGTAPTALGTLGALFVCAGVLVVRGASTHGVGFGLAIAATIAGYTVVDDHGIRHAAPIPYLACVLAPVAVAVLALEVRGGRVAEVRNAVGVRSVAAAVGSFAAYALVLAALEQAPAAPVAAVRETSILFALVLAALTLRERVGARRWLGAGVLAVGAALAAAG